MASPVLAADADKAAAKAHYEAATRLYDIKEWSKALDEYKAAYLAKPDPAFLFNIGQCYRKLAKPAQALEFYREYLKKAPPDDPARPTVEARVREMEAGDLFENDGSAAPPKPIQLPAVPVPPQPGPVETTPGPAAPAVDSVSPESRSAAPAPPQAAPRLPLTPPTPLTPGLAEPPPAPGVDLSATAPSSPDDQRPYYKTWWFWTGVGAAVVGGTVVALLSASGSHGNTASTDLGTQAVFQ